MRTLSLLWLLLPACTSAAVPAARRADGSWHLKCGASLNQCVQKADELCKSRGFVVLGGKSTRVLYGAELGVSQVEARDSELDVACADRRGDLPVVQSGNPPPLALPPRPSDTSTEPPAPPKALSKPPSLVCTPGATQQCVGAGACSGGQSCTADGSGFGPCDCGARH